MYEFKIEDTMLTASNVSVIPAIKPSAKNRDKLTSKIRVAAYCRVSTGDESQETSYTEQKRFYESLISSKKGWEFAGIYADKAISGTSRAKRVGFNKMIEDAANGRLDYIITKSISRFARNTVDTLNCVRELKQKNPPVGIYFEKENIDTLDAKGELILTILSALAQEESRSISDNIRWTFQKQFQEGISHVNLKRMIGYDKGAGGKWVINEEQAKTVRYIYEQYTCGKSALSIAKALNEMGVGTVNGKKWRADSVLFVLRNEKYVGDLAMQKTVTKDFLTHRSTINRGEAPKYYVQNHHPAIVDRIIWNKAQAMLADGRKAKVREPKRGARLSPFTNLVCGRIVNGKECGSPLVRMNYSAEAVGYRDERCLEVQGENGEKYKERYYFHYPVWRCESKINTLTSGCVSDNICECALEQSFMEMLYRLKRDYAVKEEYSELVKLFDKTLSHIKTKSVIKNYNFFVECLKALSETNKAGQPLKVYGLNTDGSPDLEQNSKTPNDYLPFERSIYMAFVKKGIVMGDVVVYNTNFGVSLISVGNSRSLDSFVGFRKCDEVGNAVILNSAAEVNGRRISYSRKLKKSK